MVTNTRSIKYVHSSLLYSFPLLLLLLALPGLAKAGEVKETQYKRIPTQFIAALADPAANSGNGAQDWGLWQVDPGPRGVWLNDFSELEKADGIAPAKWQFDKADWWMDENGLVMEKPGFPVAPGKYVVTGDREAISVLTIHPADTNGNRRWQLDFGASLHDVTHLPCRSARYTPVNDNQSCSPALAQQSSFPVRPGAIMPTVKGCQKQDYSVLFVIGVALES